MRTKIRTSKWTRRRTKKLTYRQRGDDKGVSVEQGSGFGRERSAKVLQQQLLLVGQLPFGHDRRCCCCCCCFGRIRTKSIDRYINRRFSSTASSRCCCYCEFSWTIQIPRNTFEKKFAAKLENRLLLTVAKAAGESPGSLTGFYRTTPESVSNDAWKFNRFFIERR